MTFLSLRQWLAFLTCATVFALLFVQMNLFNSLSPFLLKETNLTLTDLSSLSSALYWGNALGLLFSGRILDTQPIKTVLILISALLCLVSGLFALCYSFTELFICRFVMGICGAFLFIGPIRYFAQIMTRQNRLGFVISMLGLAGFLGGFFSQKVLLNLFLDTNWRTVLLALAFFHTGVLLIQALSLVPLKPINPSPINPSLKESPAWMRPEVLLLACYAAIMNCSISIIGAFWGNQFLTMAYHLGLREAASLSSALFLGHLLCTPLIHFFLKTDKANLMLTKIAPLLALLICLSLFNQMRLSFNLIYLAMFVLGATSSVLPAIYSRVVRLVPASMTARASSLISLALFLATGMLQPLISLIKVTPGGLSQISTAVLLCLTSLLYLSAYWISGYCKSQPRGGRSCAI